MELSMKKILTSLAAVVTLASTLSADLARVEMGVGVFEQTPSGYATRTDGDGFLNLDGTYRSSENSVSEMYAWLLIKHPIPIIPNLRLEYVSISDEGITTGKVEGISVADGPTTVDTKQYDIIPYYNILDNTFWITLDLGLDIKVIESDTNVQAGIPLVSSFAPSFTTPSATLYSSTDTTAIPLLYVRTRVEIPVTNIGLEADVKAISDGTNTFYDVRAKVDYTLGFIPVIQPALEIGYRIQQLTVDDGDTQIDLNYAGVYAGLMLRF
jgi:outer membrane protein